MQNFMQRVAKNARILSFVCSILYLHLSLGNVCGKCFDNSETSRGKIHHRARSGVRDNFEIHKNYDVHGLSQTTAR